MSISRHRESRIVGHTPQELATLVADVARYPEFLPWCLAARVRSRTSEAEIADLVIGFGPFRETFTSRVTIDQEGQARGIRSVGIAGPFRQLESTWRFAPDAGGCRVDFELAFEFRSALLQHTVRALFAEAVRRMVAAFEKRAGALYGPPRQPSRAVAVQA